MNRDEPESSGAPVMSADSEPYPQDEPSSPCIDINEGENTNRSRTSFSQNWTTKKVACISVTIVFVIGLFTLGGYLITTGKTGTESETPREGQAQQQSSGTNYRINAIPAGILPAYKYLHSKGLDVPVRAANSCCPPEICRKRKFKMFTDSHPKIVQNRTCSRSDVERVKNASCFMCRNTGAECFSFEQLLRGENCSLHPPTGCEKAHMANLNGHCSGDNGTAISVGRYDFKCDCFHGRAGDRCENVEETENVYCMCYNRKVKLLETWKELKLKDCNSTYYSSNVTCIIRSFEKENCYCEADLNATLRNCDIHHNPMAERQRSNNAQRSKSYTSVSLFVFGLVVQFYKS